MARYRYVTELNPPAPFMTVSLRCLATGHELSGLPAQVDSAADRTIVPGPTIAELGLVPDGRVVFQGFGSQLFELPIYLVEIKGPDLLPMPIRVALGENEPYLLLGRDVLNACRVLLDGPHLALEITRIFARQVGPNWTRITTVAGDFVLDDPGHSMIGPSRQDCGRSGAFKLDSCKGATKAAMAQLGSPALAIAYSKRCRSRIITQSALKLLIVAPSEDRIPTEPAPVRVESVAVATVVLLSFRVSDVPLTANFRTAPVTDPL